MKVFACEKSDAMTTQYYYRVDDLTSQYIQGCTRQCLQKYGNKRKRYEKALRYGRQPICIPCGNADPGDHYGPTALRGINR